MGFLPSNSQSFSGDNSRRTGRIRVKNVRCTLGDVVDISLNGLRVAIRGPAPERGMKLRLAIQGACNPFEVDATVVWVAQVGKRCVHVGLAFDNPTAAVRAELLSLARAAPLDITHKDAG
jgi:hypothetical protein